MYDLILHRSYSSQVWENRIQFFTGVNGDIYGLTKMVVNKRIILFTGLSITLLFDKFDGKNVIIKNKVIILLVIIMQV